MKDYVYGRMRRLGLKVNPRRSVDWTGLAEELQHRRPREIAAERDVPVSVVYWAARQRGISHRIRPRALLITIAFVPIWPGV